MSKPIDNENATLVALVNEHTESRRPVAMLIVMTVCNAKTSALQDKTLVALAPLERQGLVVMRGGAPPGRDPRPGNRPEPSVVGAVLRSVPARAGAAGRCGMTGGEWAASMPQVRRKSGQLPRSCDQKWFATCIEAGPVISHVRDKDTILTSQHWYQLISKGIGTELSLDQEAIIHDRLIRACLQHIKQCLILLGKEEIEHNCVDCHQGACAKGMRATTEKWRSFIGHFSMKFSLTNTKEAGEPV